jgi:AcrR family transcriptional regulator
MDNRIESLKTKETLNQDRVEWIIKRATELIVKQGYHQTKMRQIVQACGMGSGGLYHYVGSKLGILRLILRDIAVTEVRLIERLRDSVALLGPTDALKAGIATYLRIGDNRQDEFIFVDREIGNLPKGQRRPLLNAEVKVIAFFETLLKSGVEAGEFKIDDPTIVAHNIIATHHTWMSRRWFLSSRYTLEQYTREYTNFLLNAISSKSSRAAEARE